MNCGGSAMELGLSGHMHQMALGDVADGENSGHASSTEIPMYLVEDSPAETVFGNAITGGLVLENLPVLERIALRCVSSGFRNAVNRTCEDVRTLAWEPCELYAVMARNSATRSLVDNSRDAIKRDVVQTALTTVDSRTLGTLIGRATACALRACQSARRFSLPADRFEQLAILAEVVLLTAFCGASQNDDNVTTDNPSSPLLILGAAPGPSTVPGTEIPTPAPVPARFPHLTSVELPKCTSVTSASITALVAGCPSLTHLDLSGCTQVDDAAVVSLARRLSSLSSLLLSECHRVTDEAIASLASNARPLATLALRGCRRITDRSLAALGAGCPTLRSLSVADCRSVTDAGVTSLAQGCPLLRDIDLEMCGWVTDAGIIALLRRPASASHGTPCAGPSRGSVAESSSPSAANSSSSSVSAATGAAAIAPVHSRDERGSDSAAGGNAGGSGDGNAGIGREGAGASNSRQQAAGAGNWNTPGAGNPGMAGGGNQGTAGAGNQGVAVGGGLQAAGAGAVGAWLGGYRPLTRVGLSACSKLTDELGLRDHTLALLAHRAGDRLRVIKVGSCRALTDLGLCTLALECPSLTHVDVNSCSSLVTDAFLRLLAERCPRLSRIKLWGCLGVTDAGVSALAAAPCREWLEYFHCAGCEGLTDASLVPLVEACPRLVEVEAWCCKGVTVARINDVLKSRQARLESLCL
eukprot:jgi/Mesvir1/5568/Mv15590-RA.1